MITTAEPFGDAAYALEARTLVEEERNHARLSALPPSADGGPPPYAGRPGSRGAAPGV
ncbi:hypothetical protein [Streptomyces sp. NPDC101181]|uniref:hypothetical protein n=1 Tax=Streptomyces sp. NPDC101181 TaxID=3366125 RepID=UPI00381B4F7F